MIRLGLAATAMLVSGCASMAEGTVEGSRGVLITSDPSGAAVVQGARTLCETPCTVRSYNVRLTEPLDFRFRDGRSTRVDLGMEFNGAILGNLIFGGLLGTAIDVASGRAIVGDRHIHATGP